MLPLQRPGTWPLLYALSCALVSGCGPSSPPSTQPTSMYDRQEQALHDPFGYSPDLKKSDMSVSGEGEFDTAALKRDLNHVANP